MSSLLVQRSQSLKGTEPLLARDDAKGSMTKSRWQVVTVLLVAAVLLLGLLGSNRDPVTAVLRPSAVGAFASPSNAGAQLHGSDVIRRFISTTKQLERIKATGNRQLFTYDDCPEALALGMRWQSEAAPRELGNFVRAMDGMDALEWGSGSSSVWALLRVGTLTSIEHDTEWWQPVSVHMNRTFRAADFARWTLHTVPKLPRKDENEPQNFQYRDYYGAAFLPPQATYDFISVDGRARVDCFRRALELIKPDGGILVLDNSDRAWYSLVFDHLVPQHWLSYHDTTPSSSERTTVWVTCTPATCPQAAGSA